MKIKNKFNLGDVIYYPSVDLRSSRVFKGKITGIIIQKLDGKEVIGYQAGQPYAVIEEDASKQAKRAIKRLVEIIKDKKKEIEKDMDKAIKQIKDSDPDDLIYDLTAQYEEAEDEKVESVGTPDEETEE